MAKKKQYNNSVIITPYELIGWLTEEDRVFCWLHAIIGMPASKAYQSAFKDSKARLSSCSAQASRLLREKAVVGYMRLLYSYFSCDQLILFNEKAIK